MFRDTSLHTSPVISSDLRAVVGRMMVESYNPQPLWRFFVDRWTIGGAVIGSVLSAMVCEDIVGAIPGATIGSYLGLNAKILTGGGRYLRNSLRLKPLKRRLTS